MTATPLPSLSPEQSDDLTAIKQAIAELELRSYQAQLEQKIQEQAAELARANEQLQSHIDASRWIEQKLIAERDFIAAILDTVDALVIVLDREGRTIRFNRTCEETTGYTFDEVRGQPFWNLFLIPAEVEPVRAVLAELRTDRISNRHETYWLTRDGRKRLIAWSNTALPDDNGEVEYIICTGIDITERRLAETQAQRVATLEERQRLARELHDAVTQTFFSASLIAEVLPEMWERDPAHSRRLLQDLQQLSRGALAEMRTLLLELRPAALREAQHSLAKPPSAPRIFSKTRLTALYLPCFPFLYFASLRLRASLFGLPSYCAAPASPPPHTAYDSTPAAGPTPPAERTR